MQVITVPTAEASAVLAQLTASKLRAREDVALCGPGRAYWQARALLEMLGVSERPTSVSVLSLLSDRAMSSAFASAPLMDRAASVVACEALRVADCRADGTHGLGPGPDASGACRHV